MLKNKSIIKKIQERREENEEGEVICITEITENIKRVFANKPLTRPLKSLNRSCKFRKMYNLAFNLKEEKRIKQERKEYNQRPETKVKNKEYHKKYYARPETKVKMKEYSKKYYARPETKVKMKAYQKKYLNKPEVKARLKEQQRKYSQRPEVKIMRREYERKRHLRLKSTSNLAGQGGSPS